MIIPKYNKDHNTIISLRLFYLLFLNKNLKAIIINAIVNIILKNSVSFIYLNYN